MTPTHAIADDRGIIYKGDENTMTDLFRQIMDGKTEAPEIKGDLMLMMSIKIWRR